jgi:hypothetical protein
VRVNECVSARVRRLCFRRWRWRRHGATLGGTRQHGATHDARRAVGRACWVLRAWRVAQAADAGRRVRYGRERLLFYSSLLLMCLRVAVYFIRQLTTTTAVAYCNFFT